MLKYYNKSLDVRARSTRFNPDFWEIPVEQNVLNQFPREANPHYETPEDTDARIAQRERSAQLIPQIRDLLNEILTPKQREIVCLYFFEEKTEYEIAAHLKISVPNVSQHLFGKMRGGKVVGGALPKLRKKLVQIYPEELEA